MHDGRASEVDEASFVNPATAPRPEDDDGVEQGAENGTIDEFGFEVG